MRQWKIGPDRETLRSSRWATQLFWGKLTIISARQHSKSSTGTATNTVNIFRGGKPSKQRKGHQAQWHSVLLDLHMWMWYKGISDPEEKCKVTLRQLWW